MTLDPQLVEFIERGGRTKRSHTTPTITQQTVADHSFGVAWWCYVICKLKDLEPSAALLLGALSHDLAEHATGDIPAPTKRALGISEKVAEVEQAFLDGVGLNLPFLNTEEARILRLADSLELLQYCVRERSMGNRTKQLAEMFENVRFYSTEVARLSELELVCKVIADWEEM